MIFIALVAAPAAAAVHPGTLKVFQDWTVGCDNGRACQAVALEPEIGDDVSASMAVRHGAAPAAAPEIDFAAAGAVAIMADGRRLAARLVPHGDGARVAAGDEAAVIAALRSAHRLTLLDAKGGPVGAISLAGASAALLYMDDRQGRVGTVTALARPGPKPSSSMPPPPTLPVVQAAPASSAPAIAPAAARVKALRHELDCEIEDVGGPDLMQTHRLDGQHTLVLLSCGSGAYNLSMVPLIAEPNSGGIRIAPAPFETPQSWWDKGKPELINPYWDAKTGILSTFSQGRSMGDCGVKQSYAWDGARFRLVRQEEMGVCRGATDFITTWRAEVVRR